MFSVAFIAFWALCVGVVALNGDGPSSHAGTRKNPLIGSDVGLPVLRESVSDSTNLCESLYDTNTGKSDERDDKIAIEHQQNIEVVDAEEMEEHGTHEARKEGEADEGGDIKDKRDTDDSQMQENPMIMNDDDLFSIIGDIDEANSDDRVMQVDSMTSVRTPSSDSMQVHEFTAPVSSETSKVGRQHPETEQVDATPTEHITCATPDTPTNTTMTTVATNTTNMRIDRRGYGVRPMPRGRVAAPHHHASSTNMPSPQIDAAHLIEVVEAQTQHGLEAPRGTLEDVDIEEMLGSAGEPQMAYLDEEEEDEDEEDDNAGVAFNILTANAAALLPINESAPPVATHKVETAPDFETSASFSITTKRHGAVPAHPAAEPPIALSGQYVMSTPVMNTTLQMKAVTRTSPSPSLASLTPGITSRRRRSPRGPQMGELTTYGTKVQTPQVMGLPWHEEWDEDRDHGPDSKLTMVRKLFSVYRFKGLGLTFQKPLKNWYSVGFGFRIPLTAHFPQYDRYVSLPRLSMSLVGYWPFDAKIGFSMSVPITQVVYALAVIGSEFGLKEAIALSEKIRKVKASDSIKRVGLNFSIYWNKKRGLRTSIGPWAFYLPTRRVMNKYVLPLLLTLPAILASIVDHVLPALWLRQLTSAKAVSHERSLESEMDSLLSPLSACPGSCSGQGASDAAAAAAAAGAGAISASTSTTTTTTTTTTTAAAAAAAADAATAVFAPTAEDVAAPPSGKEPTRQRRTFGSHREKLITFAATKTGGLGANFSLKKMAHTPASMGSTLQFNVSPFFRNSIISNNPTTKEGVRKFKARIAARDAKRDKRQRRRGNSASGRRPANAPKERVEAAPTLP